MKKIKVGILQSVLNLLPLQYLIWSLTQHCIFYIKKTASRAQFVHKIDESSLQQVFSKNFFFKPDLILVLYTSKFPECFNSLIFIYLLIIVKNKDQVLHSYAREKK